MIDFEIPDLDERVATQKTVILWAFAVRQPDPIAFAFCRLLLPAPVEVLLPTRFGAPQLGHQILALLERLAQRLRDDDPVAVRVFRKATIEDARAVCVRAIKGAT